MTPESVPTSEHPGSRLWIRNPLAAFSANSLDASGGVVARASKPFAFAIEIALHAQCRKLVGDDAHVPPTTVSIGKDRWRRFILMTLAERAKLIALRRRRFDVEVAGPLLTLGRNDDPAARDGVLTKLRHGPSMTRRRRCFGFTCQSKPNVSVKRRRRPYERVNLQPDCSCG